MGPLFCFLGWVGDHMQPFCNPSTRQSTNVTGGDDAHYTSAGGRRGIGPAKGG